MIARGIGVGIDVVLLAIGAGGVGWWLITRVLPHCRRGADGAGVIGGVALALLLLTTWGAQSYRIPSESMIPTVYPGDFVLVNRLAYNLDWPVLDRPLLRLGRPARGDVVVFRPPWAPGEAWIKRVVGVPGDRVVVQGEEVWVNGVRIEAKATGPYVARGGRSEARLQQMGGELWRERHGAREYTTLRTPRLHTAPDVPNARNPEMVPADCYFLLGDDRDDSRDSRFEGCVPGAALAGRAVAVWLSLGSLGHSFRRVQ